ncbi:hypothetical protein PtA15_2A455 [Puccinia triticina]|nr:uncharacterized protein PtA15_2A455 [Puccinia triticina]WAQ82141.1 hypothetical protein PtA15_2A455 [Puccinia triticina]WAR53000.1 hypothetical protein PtB15_2B428 [Puccinia triticina]
MNEAAFRLACKIGDEVYMGIFNGCDDVPYKIWSKLTTRYAAPTSHNRIRAFMKMEQLEFKGDMPAFIIEVEGALAGMQCVGWDVMDHSTCGKIIFKLTKDRPQLLEKFSYDTEPMSDPYMLLERVRQIELDMPIPETNTNPRKRPRKRCKDGSHNPRANHPQHRCFGLHPEMRAAKKLRSRS